ncbi:unnamed protein product [Adineta steineri]|uniref:Uncharacterized protein n=1 Tax=Adineta steineri TaxID=433720 RepID=A0A815CXX6_9BILA|nr:unnamed protein product [Adineta steineri]CAF1568491.1 unnamed protein product [Adineta steineri]
MEAIFISFISLVIINTCLARYSSYSGSSDISLSTGAIIGIAVGGGVFLIIIIAVPIIIVCCLIKQANKRKMGIAPFAGNTAWAQQQNQYQPPGFNQASYSGFNTKA